MGVTRTKLHWPQRPRRARCATGGRLGQQLELSDAPRALTNARSRAIGAGVTPTDDYHMAIPCFFDRLENWISLKAAILRGQEIHPEMDSCPLSTWDRQMRP